MIKKLVQVSVAVFCAMSGFRGAAAEKAATVGRPNFVLCMADDQTPSLPGAGPRSEGFRCGGRGSNF